MPSGRERAWYSSRVYSSRCAAPPARLFIHGMAPPCASSPFAPTGRPAGSVTRVADSICGRYTGDIREMWGRCRGDGRLTRVADSI